MTHELTADIEAGGEREKRALKLIRTTLKEFDGVILHTAAELGVSKWTMFRWMDIHPELREYARKLREDSGEHAERIAAARESRWAVTAKRGGR